MATKGLHCCCIGPSIFDSLRLLTFPLRTAISTSQLPPRTFSSTAIPAHRTKKKAQHYNARDQYRRAQAKQRRDANLSRQVALKEERAKAMGTPIRGVETDFLRSLDLAQSAQARRPDDADSLQTTSDPKEPPPSPANAMKEEHLNHLLTKKDLEESLEYSRNLAEPVLRPNRVRVDPFREKEERDQFEARDKAAQEVLSRITSLNNASGRQKHLTNVQRIIQEFGRHNTDTYLKPKAPANLKQQNKTQPEALPRVGPDTGSSEVQIAILTAKIRKLADRYDGAHRNDKVNKRNLLLLMHRRQKLLKYMQKQERGSGRWHHMIETLGLTEATWKGEINI